MEELEELLEDYVGQYPDSESPLNLMSSLGDDALMDILRNRKGREILLGGTSGRVNPDQQSWRYGPAV